MQKEKNKIKKTGKNKKDSNNKDGHSFVRKELLEKKVKVSKKIHPKADEPMAQKSKKSEKRDDSDEKKIDQQLVEIYENPDGSMPDMSHFQKVKERRFIRSLVVLLVACAFLAVVAWVGFFVIQPHSGFSEKGVILSISGDEFVAVGGDVRYRIRYRNSQNTALRNVLLQIRYPQGFVLTDTSVAPTGENKDEWMLGRLGEQESGYIDIFGKMYGDLGQRQSFRVFLNYMAENFSSEFQKVDSVNVEVAEGPVGLVIEGPEEVVVGSEVELVITLDKKDNIDLENLSIEIDGGSLFSVRESEPKMDEFVDNRWNLSAQDNGQKVVIRGLFNSDASENKGNIGIKLLGWKDSNKNVDGYVYGSYAYSVKLLQADITANLAINGATGKITVQPGEVLNSTIVLRNFGTVPLKNVTARVIFDAPSFEKKSILDWAEIDNPQDADIVGEQLNAETRRGILSWSRKQISDLWQIDPDEEIIADFSLPIKDSQDINLNDFIGYKIEATLEVRYDLGDENKLISSAPILMILNSDTDFEVRDDVSYADGEEIHMIDWVITNTFHELENIKLEADIYGDVTWDESQLSVPAGEVEYTEENKKLKWTIEKMPLSLDVLALRFGIILNSQNPTQTNLTSKVVLEATDAVTGEEFLKVGKEILLNTQ